jgi:xylulokinase
MEEKFGLEKIYNLTGQAEIPAGYPAPKIEWLKDNAPEIFNNADKFLLLEDYIVYRLTGKFCSSRSLFSSSLLMNVHTGEYIPEILDWLGISEKQLPKLCESGVLVGEYNGIKVTTSALDQIAGITAAGVTKCGIMSETTGTSLAVCALTENFPPYYEGLKVSIYYVKKGVYCLLMWAPTAGACLEWFKGGLCEDISLKELDGMAEKLPEGSEGLIALPHLCGTVMPENRPNAKGVFFGVELKHTRAHFARAIMESVAYMIREYVEYMGLSLDEIALLFIVPNGLAQLNELIDARKREKEILTLVISTFKQEQDAMESLSARDLYFLLRRTELSPSLEELISAFETLSKDEVGVLTQVKKASATENTTYEIHGGKYCVNRLRALANAIEKGLS